jgi:hypothetical protein
MYLDCQPVLVDGDFLDEIPTLDPNLLLRHQVLDDHIRHVLRDQKIWVHLFAGEFLPVYKISYPGMKDNNQIVSKNKGVSFTAIKFHTQDHLYVDGLVRKRRATKKIPTQVLHFTPGYIIFDLCEFVETHVVFYYEHIYVKKSMLFTSL